MSLGQTDDETSATTAECSQVPEIWKAVYQIAHQVHRSIGDEIAAKGSCAACLLVDRVHDYSVSVSESKHGVAW